MARLQAEIFFIELSEELNVWNFMQGHQI